MGSELIKGVLLLLFGGLCTFIVSTILNKLQKEKPKMTWQKSPMVQVHQQDLCGVSWTLRNDGNNLAKDVRVKFSLPINSIFTSFSVVPSNKALVHIIEEDNDTIKTLVYPSFPSSVAVEFSAIIKGIPKDDIDISVLGEGVIGKEKTSLSFDDIDKKRKRSNFILSTLYTVIAVFIAVFSLWTLISVYYKVQTEHAEAVVDLYLQTGNKDKAIIYLENIQESRTMIGRNSSLDYLLSKLYASKGESAKSIVILNYLRHRDFPIYIMISTDTAFDKIRSTPEFKAFITAK